MNFVDKEEQTGGTVDWPQNIQTTNLNCYIKSRIYIINGQSTVLPLLSFLFELRYVIFWKKYIFDFLCVIHSYISKTIVIFVSNLEGEEKAFHDYYASNDPKYEKTYYSLPWGSWIIYTFSAYTENWVILMRFWLWIRFQIIFPRMGQCDVRHFYLFPGVQ